MKTYDMDYVTKKLDYVINSECYDKELFEYSRKIADYTWRNCDAKDNIILSKDSYTDNVEVILNLGAIEIAERCMVSLRKGFLVGTVTTGLILTTVYMCKKIKSKKTKESSREI